MTRSRKIINARAGADGNINGILLEGNTNYLTPERVILMAENGEVDATVVNNQNGDKHLRSRPDGKKKNNLDYMAGEP